MAVTEHQPTHTTETGAMHMSLNFNFKNTGILERLGDALWFEDDWGRWHLDPVADAMVWSAVIVDVGSLYSRELVDEHLTRLRIFEGVVSPFWVDESLWDRVDPDEFVGMQINVSPVTRRQWLAQRIFRGVPDPTTQKALAEARRGRSQKAVIEEVAS